MNGPYEVKRIEAIDFLAELKSFTFEQSPDVRSDLVNGFEVIKTFYHKDRTPDAIAEKYGRQICKSTFEFTAHRLAALRKKRGFAFMLSSTVERTLGHLDPYRRSLIAPAVAEAYKNFDEIEEGVLTEAVKLEFNTSEYDPREIDFGESYEIKYGGDAIYSTLSEDALYQIEGMVAQIDPSEDDDELTQLFIPEPIPRERLELVDNVLTNTEFWDMMEPVRTFWEQGTTYRSAADHMREIMETIRTGKVKESIVQEILAN